ncbi:FG-GAP repeat protein [Massilia sp. Leaf139]|uniref:XAC2610-related protein n=1 Tax=Massilia sp. Leaf139 TaxID=1736272 RepID=UPI0006F71C5F|nr:FG-GAP repeat protein [Massilia sp. Leaf139]KQQ96922.1 hypothetical protein ASF77_02815 [Massilia sp. Leaf139]
MLWTKYTLALLCCASLPAWAADPWCSARGKPALTFEWVPKDQADPKLGSVRIKDVSGKTVQVIDEMENYYGDSESDSESFDTRTDFNNDGCPDLVVTGSIAGIGNESQVVFLYERRTRRFAANEALSNIGGLELDPKDRNCVGGSWKSGADSVYTSRHCWKNGKLVMTNEYRMSPRLSPAGEFACYEHVETEYRDGRKRTKTSCTKTY